MEGREQSSGRPLIGGGSELGPVNDRTEPLLRPEAVARLLACSPKTVYAWAAMGSLPSVRLGRLVRFRPADVRRFVQAHTEANEEAQ